MDTRIFHKIQFSGFISAMIALSFIILISSLSAPASAAPGLGVTGAATPTGAVLGGATTTTPTTTTGTPVLGTGTVTGSGGTVTSSGGTLGGGSSVPGCTLPPGSIGPLPGWCFGIGLPPGVNAPGSLAVFFCDMITWFNGNLGKGLASLAVITVGLGAMFAKIEWKTAILVGVGVSVIFGATGIYNSMNLGTANDCTNVLALAAANAAGGGR